MNAAYLFLVFAIVTETIATMALKASASFTKLGPSLITVVCYGVSFYALSHALKEIPTGIAYAIWSGIGIVLISTISWIVFKQRLELPVIFGLVLILAGVVVVNIFSKPGAH